MFQQAPMMAPQGWVKASDLAARSNALPGNFLCEWNGERWLEGRKIRSVKWAGNEFRSAINGLTFEDASGYVRTAGKSDLASICFRRVR